MAALQRLLTRSVAPPARGVSHGRGAKRIVVSCDPVLFDRINMLAGASGVPFAEAVRQLLERGLLESEPSRRRAIAALDRLAAGDAVAQQED